MAGITFSEHLLYIDLLLTGALGGVMVGLAIASRLDRWVNG